MKYIAIILFCIFSGNCFAQVLSNNGAVATIATGTVVNAATLQNTAGTITNNGTISLTANYINGGTVNGSGNYNVAGNWNNSGTFTSGAGAVTFNGAAQQNFTGGGNFSNLTLNNSSGLVLNNNLTVASTLTLTNGAVSIASNTLTLNGAVTGSGTLSGSSTSNLVIGGNAGNINFTTGFRTLKDFTLSTNATATLGTPLNIIAGASAGTIIVNSGATLTTAGNLFLKSDANGTASVGNSAGAITGNVTAERYVPGRRKYRLITSPVTTHANATLVAGQEAFSIWGNWQNSGNNVTANIGTFITGGTAGDGFDVQTTNASLYSYDDATKLYVRHGTSSGKNTKYTPLKAGVAYYMFVYGDRTNTITTSTPKNTTLSSTGTLLMGDQLYTTASSIPLSNVTGRFTLLGNPFASPINWATIPKTNLDNTYWGWDPNLASTGGYITVTTTGTVTLLAPFSGTTGLNQYIQPGQGFFVKTSSASPTLTIREQDKVSNFNGAAFRTTQNARTTNNISLLAINLQYPNGANKVLADGVLAAFDPSFLKTAGPEDAAKMVNTAESIAIQNDTTSLIIDARPMPASNDTLFLTLARLTKPQYTLQIFANRMAGNGVSVFLQDRYLNTLQPLSVSDTNNIVINTSTTIPASVDVNRFRIVFQSVGTTLPVKYTSVKAAQTINDIQVDWQVAEETNIQKYEVEKSGDGITFNKAATVNANGSSNENYTWLDAQAITGNNYYRIRAVQNDGQFFLSKIVMVKMNAGQSDFMVYPNPVQNQQINIHSNNKEKGSYNLLLTDANGRQIINTAIDHHGGSFKQIIYPAKKLTPGIYYLQIGRQKENFRQRIFIE